MKNNIYLLKLSVLIVFCPFLIQANPINTASEINQNRIYTLNDSTKKEKASILPFRKANNIAFSSQKGKFEFGLEFGLFNTNIEYLLSYKELSRGIQIHSGERHHSSINGLSFTRRIADKWWLQTGLRYGRSVSSDDILFEAFYNKTGEQLQADGKVLYDLTLVSSGSIDEIETMINVSVTNASSLDNDDLIVSALLIKNRLDWLQIPLGVVYRLGKQDLNYEIKSGLSLNQITTSNYQVEGLIEGSVSNLLINEITYPQRNSTRFLGTYLGLGLRYNLTENIIIHTNFNLRYEPKIQVYVNHVFTSLHFGASYLF